MIKSTSWVVVLLCGLASLPAFAHHSFGHYNMGAVTEVEGTIHKYEWSNPHCWLFVDVTKAGGPPVTYGFELQSVGEMLRRGWKKNSLKFGDKVKIKFRPMKDGTPAGLLVSAELDGKLIGNSMVPEAPPPPAK